MEEQKHSRLGIASFITSIASGILRNCTKTQVVWMRVFRSKFGNFPGFTFFNPTRKYITQLPPPKRRWFAPRLPPTRLKRGLKPQYGNQTFIFYTVC